MNGFVVLRRESHAILYLVDGDQWNYDPLEARRFDSRITAERCRRRVGGHDILSAQTARWLRGPTMQPVAMYAVHR